MSEDEYTDEEMDTDEELQAAFASKQLGESLVSQKTYTNNVSGLKEKLLMMRSKELNWLERMSVTATVATVEKEEGVPSDPEGAGEDDAALDVNNDFQREMHFVHQAQSAVKIGLEKLKEYDIPITRPENYFAEMVKADDHMRKVKEQLLLKQKRIDASEKARKLRDLRKYGKKVQQEVIQRRQLEKKSTLQAVKKFAKGKGDRPGFLSRNDEDEDFPTTGKKPTSAKSRDKKRLPMKSKKRQMKDKSYGFGGKKRGSKRNTASSSADMSGFSSARHSKAPATKRKQTAAQKRPGKSRRQQTRKKFRK